MKGLHALLPALNHINDPDPFSWEYSTATAQLCGGLTACWGSDCMGGIDETVQSITVDHVSSLCRVSFYAKVVLTLTLI